MRTSPVSYCRTTAATRPSGFRRSLAATAGSRFRIGARTAHDSSLPPGVLCVLGAVLLDLARYLGRAPLGTSGRGAHFTSSLGTPSPAAGPSPDAVPTGVLGVLRRGERCLRSTSSGIPQAYRQPPGRPSERTEGPAMQDTEQPASHAGDTPPTAVEEVAVPEPRSGADDEPAVAEAV